MNQTYTCPACNWSVSLEVHPLLSDASVVVGPTCLNCQEQTVLGEPKEIVVEEAVEPYVESTEVVVDKSSKFKNVFKGKNA